MLAIFPKSCCSTDTSGAPGESGDQGSLPGVSLASNFSPPTPARVTHCALDTASPSPLLGPGAESDTSQQVCWSPHSKVQWCNCQLFSSLQHQTFSPVFALGVYHCWCLLILASEPNGWTLICNGCW